VGGSVLTSQTSKAPTIIQECTLRLRTFLPSVRPSERKVAQYILSNPESVVELPITELARLSGVSDATVVKLCQRVGYSGFQELKINLARELSMPYKRVYGKVKPGDTMEEIKEKAFSHNERALHDTARILNSVELESAVSALSAAPRIHFYGSGASGIVALDAEQKFLRIGMNCQAFNDPHLGATAAALLDKGAVAVGISHSGATRDTVDSLTIAHRAGATTVCITNAMGSPIAQAADTVLLTAVAESDFRGGAMASRIAQLSVIDILFIGVALGRHDHTMQCLAKTLEAVAHKRY
jgi:RpiR family carbohydrate utilization transcriptional regulator